MYGFLIFQEFKKVQSPITAVAWNAGGNLLAYAASYDWGMGHSGASRAFERPQIFVHACLDNEVRPSPK